MVKCSIAFIKNGRKEQVKVLANSVNSALDEFNAIKEDYLAQGFQFLGFIICRIK